jgi:hypothetical protein
MINKPREIYVDDGNVGLMRFEIENAAGVRHIVNLKEQLRLPAPQG